MPILSAEELAEKLSVAVERLKDALKPTAVYLYGSYADGTTDRHSDLDLLVIVEGSDLNAYERDAAAYRALCGLGVPKDVQVYTRAEFQERASLPVSFERTVKERGRLIYVAA